MIILHEANADGIVIRLIEQGIASFAITYSDGALAAIAHRTNDLACAKNLFNRSVEIACIGFTHPAWKQPTTKQIPINIGG
jgi:hypothetical protein